MKTAVPPSRFSSIATASSVFAAPLLLPQSDSARHDEFAARGCALFSAVGREDDGCESRARVRVYRGLMDAARAAAVVTWVYAAAFGLPAIPVARHLQDNGRLPMLGDLFELYGGPWSARMTVDDLTVRLYAFAGLTLAMSLAVWALWRRSKLGALVSLAVMPIEVVFWLGFALPFPFLIGIVRLALIAAAWPSLAWRLGHTTQAG